MPFFDFFKATPKNRKTRRAEKALRFNAVEALEDRTVPTVSVSINSPFNAPFTVSEGNFVTVTGTLLDDNPLATGSSLVLQAISAPTGSTTGAPSYGEPTKAGPFNTRTFPSPSTSTTG